MDVTRDEDATTRPAEVRELSERGIVPPWQFDRPAWSFEAAPHRILPTTPSVRRNGPHANEEPGTSGPQSITSPVTSPRAPARRLGLRAWHSLADWEGVVEEVGDETFRLRLTPLVDGRPDFTRAEFAEFDFDELAYDSDRSLIAPDAVVYWTVGRRRDEAGTVSNQSLVRVRRQPPPSALRQKLAAEEVAALLDGQEDK